MSPLISVIVPVYNQEKYLGRCLRSLLDQDMNRTDYEIIVIDDGSTDRSPYALDLFVDEIRIVKLPMNRGLPSALNAGLELARGELVIRVDADDYVNYRFLSFIYAYFEMNDNVDAVACDYILVDNDERVIGRGNVDNDPIACGIMFRLEHLRELGLYDEVFLAYEDLDLRHRYLTRYSIQRLPLPLYRYRKHDSNMTGRTEYLKQFQQLLEEKHDIKED